MNVLQSFKVKLMWDMYLEEYLRKEFIKCVFSGSWKEIDENDLKIYFVSDSEDEFDGFEEENGVEVVEVEGVEVELKLFKKEFVCKKMCEVLGLIDELLFKFFKWEVVGDMQIIFIFVLLVNELKKDVDVEEIMIEKYKCKECERKERKCQQVKVKCGDVDGDEFEDGQYNDIGV